MARRLASILKTIWIVTSLAGGLAGYIALIARYPLTVVQVAAIVSMTLSVVATMAVIVVWMENRKVRRIVANTKYTN